MHARRGNVLCRNCRMSDIQSRAPASATRVRTAALIAATALASAALAQLFRIRELLRSADDAHCPRAPYEASPTQPLASVLVLGDSTGVGLGATHPEDSIAGRLGAEHPRARITNHAAIGARFEDIPAQLEAAQQSARTESFDL